MNLHDVMVECANVQRGVKANLSHRCAKAIGRIYGDGSGQAETFTTTGQMTLPYHEMHALFFPRRKRVEGEWLISTVFYRYLYQRRNRPGPPVKGWSDL